MRKIVFEQVGNAVMFLLLTLTAIDFTQRSVVAANRVTFEFGWPAFAFVGWMIVFVLLRFHEHHRDPNFSLTRGEQSAADERERLVSLKTSQRTLQSLVTLIILLLTASAVFGIDPRIRALDLRVIMLGALGLLLVLYSFGFVAFWVYYDHRI